ncbi:MAG: transglutaminase-like domain-containing protein, partial [Actinomycetota bacterium]|nr:transglutaminase-like domain-containing protein [Actinomycetota bacterium]
MNAWPSMRPSMPLVLATAAVGVAAVQLEITTGRTGVALAAGIVAVAALAHRRRVHAGSAGEVLTAIVLGGLGTVLHGLAPDQTGLGSAPLRSAVFVFAFTGLAMAALRLHLGRPEGGLPGTLAAAGIVFLACGTVRTGPWLPRLFAVYLALAFVALALDAWHRGHAPPPWRLRGRHAAAALLLVGVVPGLMWAWGETGPRLIRKSTSAVLDMFGPLHRTGFHDGPISLHALDGLSESDAVVMRVDGAAGGHLRGNVYLTYEQGRWVPAEATGAAAAAEPMGLAPRPGQGTTRARIEYVSEATDHFFLPLGARPHVVEPDVAVVDAWQLVRADESSPAAVEIALPTGLPLEPASPTAVDLDVPEHLRGALEAAVAGFVDTSVVDPAERARHLESALASDFEYSTSFREEWVAARYARPKADPVVLFIEDIRKGHCEYFASALTLMLRVDGVPARLVSGYRIAEWNAFGGWAVVRERHAHAWVEAHLPGAGWTTLDGTPIAATTALDGLAATPRLAAIFDWVARQAHVHGRTLLLVVLVVGLATVQIVRLVRGRVASGGRDGREARRISKALQAMLGRLAEAGF